MFPILFLALALAASAQAQFVFTPVYGCKWVPETTAITNFTYSRSTANDSAPAYIQWQAPALSYVCSNETTTIPKQGLLAGVPCMYHNDPISAFYQLSADRTNATLEFAFYTGCAADIYAFYYESVVPLACGESVEGTTVCGSKGNLTATVVGYEYLPPIRNPPPPPFNPTPPKTAAAPQSSNSL